MSGPADPKLSAWVSANAGAGKTRVLVERVMRLLLEKDTPPERILCLTFTKAAATEMATRLAARLSAWALMSDDDLRQAFRDIGASGSDDALLARARGLFARALETPGGLKIQTIHAFCERLLSRFPLEAGLPVHFAVADDRSAGELLRAAQDEALSDIARGGDAEGAAALETLSRLRDETGFDELLRSALARRTLVDRFLAISDDPGDRRAALARAVGLDGFMSEDEVRAEAARNLDKPALALAVERLRTGAVTDVRRGDQIAAFLSRTAPISVGDFDAYVRAFLTQDLAARAVLATNQLQQAQPELEEILRREQDRLLDVVERMRAASAAERTDAALTLIVRVLGYYETLKTRHGLLDYHDLIAKTALLLSHSASAAWVLYKLDGGLEHILIDEAQDTSPEQWTVIARLADEFFAGEGARGSGRTIFAVGDEKQSIYSFQGADPQAFDEMRRHFARPFEGDTDRWRDFELTDSYRSTEPVLGLVDRVFQAEERVRALSVGGRAVHHHLKRAGQGGRVELWPAETPDPSARPDPWTLPLDYVSPSSPVARLAQRVTDAIAHLLGGNDPLSSRDGAVRAGDILVLVQRRGPFVEELIRRLKQKGIAVAGADRLDILKHIAVMDLMALGAFALMPDDDLTLAALLRSPLIGLSDDALLDLTLTPGATLWDKLRGRSEEGLAAARAALERALARADFIPPYDFYASFLNEGSGRKKILQRLGPDANDPLDEFLRLALDYERLHPPSLQGFLAWLTRGPSEIKRDMDHGGDEVRVMTAHGAKGLEAPIVFLPDTCAVPFERTRSGFVAVSCGLEKPVPVWSRGQKHDPEPVARAVGADKDAGEAEHLRLLYVALTRARDRLVVCGHETTKGRRPLSWHRVVEEAMTDWAHPGSDPKGAPVLRFETAQAAPPDGRDATAGARAPSERLPAFLAGPPRAEAARAPVLSPSSLIAEDAPAVPVRSPRAVVDAERVRFQRGRLIHRLLERLPDVPRDVRDARARDMLKRSVYRLSPEEQDEIAAAALRVLSDPLFAAVFSRESRAEVPVIGELVLRGKSERIYGVVDRLVVTDEAALIVDYKTNRPAAASLAEVPRLYLRQMAAYRAVLRNVYPARPVEAALVWTEGPVLMRLPPESLDAALATAAPP